MAAAYEWGNAGYGGYASRKEMLTIPSSSVGRLIGRGGSKIRELQDQSNCQLKIMQGEDAGPGQTNVEVTFNTDQDFQYVSSLIRSLIDETSNGGGGGGGRFGGQQPRGGGGGGGYGGQSFNASIPEDCVGLIIGKGGARIKDIEYRVGCSVRVKNDGNGNHFAEVQGTEAQYNQVVGIISETIERQRMRAQY
jgi:far upstream element-binding protein